MHSFTAAAILGLAASTFAAPAMRELPLADGFPNPNAAQLKSIEIAAFGDLPSVAPPPTLSEDTFVSLRLIAFSETIESVFFDQLITNITENKPGFNRVPNRDFTLKTLKSMRATEELHATNAQNALKHFNKDTIAPCQYKFPVATFDEAIAFISTVTDFVQGVLGDVITKAAAAGDSGFTRGVAGALSNEGEQDGWFRFIQGERPNQKPFNTIATREYAFSKLQDVVIPGTCPNAQEIALPVFQPLNAPMNPSTHDEILTFTFSLAEVRKAPSNGALPIQLLAKPNNFATQFSKTWQQDLQITYLNGQSKPITSELKSWKVQGETVTVTALFPFSEFDMFGLSVAALTKKGDFATQDDMVKATYFAPALIETQEPLF